ncbi:MAG: DUF2090 domain-containing protein [Candidimonas sp.]|nr:MAG: DUF2090 domain-containing protein [Candidimonas sp.]TAM24668.1 MAG: DUF2090 domain-containing protein [Candidimonas sp.]TAM74356.1 MAG: DUF2090 domain-containing protein [Candidimonas sp.]
MSLGYTTPLYLLPFDHRSSYLSKMFHFDPPLTPGQQQAVGDSKRVIYDGFLQAMGPVVPIAAAGILVDEEFGASILRDARQDGYVTAVSVEKSGSDEFEFEYGDTFASHIEAVKPTFAKVLVRYNPEDDTALNRRQAARLKKLSDYCRAADQSFMFELLVPASQSQMERVGGDKNAYDLELRPTLMRTAVRALQDAGIEPDIWKIEGLDSRADCEQMVQAVRRDGRHDVSCIVLGRGADEKKVVQWLQTAAQVPGFIGFAVGRSTFWDAIADFESKKISRQDAVTRIAQRYSEWVSVFKTATGAAS